MANHKKTQRPRKPRRPLPKVGTPKDDEYRLKQSRHDIADFGLARKGGPLNWIIFGGIAVILLFGVIGLILIT